MRQKCRPEKQPAEEAMKDIQRATHQYFPAEEKIRVVLEGLLAEEALPKLSVTARACASSMYYGWSKEFLEAGKRRLAGDTARAATSEEVKGALSAGRRRALKEVMAEPHPGKTDCSKKAWIGDRGDEREPSGWSSNRLGRLDGRWKGSAFPDRAFYRWYDRHRRGGPEALADRPHGRIGNPSRRPAPDSTAWINPNSPGAAVATDEKIYVSEASVYRLLKTRTILSPARPTSHQNAEEIKNKTTAPNQLWQTDFTYLKITGWGWYYLSTVPYHPQTQGKIEH